MGSESRYGQPTTSRPTVMPPLSRSTHVEQIERLEARVAALTAALREARQWIETGCDHFENSEAVVRYVDHVLDAAAGHD